MDETNVKNELAIANTKLDHANSNLSDKNNQLKELKQVQIECERKLEIEREKRENAIQETAAAKGKITGKDLQIELVMFEMCYGCCVCVCGGLVCV